MESPPLSEWSTKLVADVAIKAQELIDGGIKVEEMTSRRNEMLDELVRREVIQSYTLNPFGGYVQPT